jgi:hypothetical protein
MEINLTKYTQLISKAWYRLLYPMWPYWTANIYGFGKWIRRYGYYPPFLPLCIYTDHGLGSEDMEEPTPQELASSAPAQFYHSDNKVFNWKKISKKPCYTLYSPFVFARKSIGARYDKDGKGTIYFVAHSTPFIEERNPVEKYHSEIQALPETFHPIAICLHIHDIRKGLDEKYRNLGYEVVTAGDYADVRFTEKFYALLKGRKYALSNEFGSYGYYVTEMGMPFGLYGSYPDWFNHFDENLPKGEYIIDKEAACFKRIYELFGCLPGEEPTQDQREFVNHQLGLNNGISRKEMAFVLYQCLFIWIMNGMKRLLIIR